MSSNGALGSRSRGSSSNGTGAAGSASPASALTPHSALAVLSIGKLSRVAAAFVSFSYLQSAVALPLYLFFVTLGASVCLLALQRPWNGRRIGARRGKKLIVAGAIMSMMLYVWSAGLRSAGPLRALLIDGAELPLLYIFAVVSGRELPERKKTRGALLMIAAYGLLIWDASGHAPDIAELESTKLGQKAEHALGRFEHLTSEKIQNFAHRNTLKTPVVSGGDGKGPAGEDAQLPPAPPGNDADNDSPNAPKPQVWRRRLLTTSHARVEGSGSVRDAFVEGTPLRSEIGVLLVLGASILMQASRPFTRRLATEVGGAKRHFALSVTTACVCLSPLALLSYMSSSSGALLSLSVIGSVERVPLGLSHVTGFAAVGFMWLVLPYYIRAIVSTAVDQKTMLQAGVVVPFVLAAVASTVFGFAASAGGVSWILIAAFLLDAIGLTIMVAGGGAKRALSELPLDSRSSSVSLNGSQQRNNSRGD